jgi:hypothetical protein
MTDLTIKTEQIDPCTVIVTCGPRKLTYVFKDEQVDGFANAWERAASFAYTMAGEPLTPAALTMMQDAKGITRATLHSGDEMAFCLASVTP